MLLRVHHVDHQDFHRSGRCHSRNGHGRNRWNGHRVTVTVLEESLHPDAGQQDQGEQQAANGDNRSENTPPGLRTGALRPEEAADLAAWGSLPERVRDALVQGSSDSFSAAYRRLTEAYYRMLAEEPKP